MTINVPDNAKWIANFAGKFVLDKDSEALLLQLKEAEDDIKKAMDIVKAAIANDLKAEGIESVKGNQATVTVYESGAKYAIDPSYTGPLDLTYVETKYAVRSDTVAAYEEAKKSLPAGIVHAKRSESVRISVKKP